MKRLALCAFLAGCITGPQGQHVSRRNASDTIATSEREKVFSRALGVVQERGWIVAVSDRAGGLLTTRTMDTGEKLCGALVCPSRGTLQITISESGAVIVNLHRELFLAAGADSRWFTPTLDRDVLPIEHEQLEILSELEGKPPPPPLVLPAPPEPPPEPAYRTRER